MRIMATKKLLYLDQDLDERLRKLAAERHESVSAMIRMALRAGLSAIESASAKQTTEPEQKTEA
jgi:predicted transcriptional regulator